MLTWWQSPLVADGRRDAGMVIADDTYRVIKLVRAGNGYQPDLHAFQIRPDGTALMTVYDAIRCDLRAHGGPANGAVADTLMQEIDLRTGLVRFEWHSLDHVALERVLHADQGQRHAEVAVGLLPHQLDRPRAERRPARRLPQHLGGL